MASKWDWNDFDWDNMIDDMDRLVGLSRYYGSDPDFLLAGGGNTSLKDDDSLFIKISGVSLGDIDRDGFVEVVRERAEAILHKSFV